ncbi:MAG: hypothetical protein WCR06_01570 [bacterium]
MHARYDRVLDKRLIPFILPGGAFHFLVREYPVDDPFALDVQLRERNKIMYYHGTTRVLTVQLRIGVHGVEAKAHAAEAYGEYPGSRQPYVTLMRWWGVGDAHAFRAAFLAYLPSAVEATDAGFYRNQQEGYWQNRLCVRYGRRWTRADELLIIDRECVVGFNHGKERDAFYRGIAGVYQGVKSRLQNDDKQQWGQPDDTGFGDELDMLAINRSGDLVALELKHGSNSSGIYWGPLQVAVYQDAFFKTLGSIRGQIRGLVAQKIELGLLPPDAGRLLEASPLTRVEPMLAVAEPNDSSQAWNMMKSVLAAMSRAGTPRPSLPLRLARIRDVSGEPGVEISQPAIRGLHN